MRKGFLKGVFFGLVFVLLISGVSANWLTDIFSKDIKFADGESSDGGTVGTPYKDTGKTVLDKYRRATITTCNDSDKGIYPGIEGFISQKVKKTNPAFPKDYVLTEKVVWDYCSGNKYGDFVVEHYCWTNGTFRSGRINCENGCENGKCKTSTPEPQASCVDSDGPESHFTVGSAISSLNGTKADICDGYVLLNEARCDASNYSNYAYPAYPCIDGCSNGKCNFPVQRTNCVDSDVDAQHPDGLDFNLASSSTAVVVDESGSHTYTARDECGNYGQLMESFCTSNNFATTLSYTCPNGCSAGRCNP